MLWNGYYRIPWIQQNTTGRLDGFGSFVVQKMEAYRMKNGRNWEHMEAFKDLEAFGAIGRNWKELEGNGREWKHTEACGESVRHKGYNWMHPAGELNILRVLFAEVLKGAIGGRIMMREGTQYT